MYIECLFAQTGKYVSSTLKTLHSLKFSTPVMESFWFEELDLTSNCFIKSIVRIKSTEMEYIDRFNKIKY